MLDAILDVLAPSRCAGCGTHAAPLCPACAAAIACRPIVRNGPPGIGRVVALGPYDGVLRCAILALKYANATTIGETLGDLLAQTSACIGDVLVPVPLHVSRLRKRGYNQAEMLGRGMLRGFGRSLREPPRLVASALIRTRATRPQSGLDHTDRRHNVEAAFRAGPGALAVEDQRVVLIDDVLTTGATLRACAAVLRRHGAASVDACCVAIKI